MIVAAGLPAARAAVTATAATPIVFAIGDDPVRHNLVANLARPGGNATGINFLSAELGSKRVTLMLELVPAAKRVILLINPAGPASETMSRDAQTAARDMGLQVDVLNADTRGEIDAAFAKVASERPDFLMVGGGGLFFNRRIQLVQLAAHHRVPAIYAEREFAELGGLMSYGTSIRDAFHQLGIYTGRISTAPSSRPAGGAVDEVRTGDQCSNRADARPECAADLLVAADEVIE